MVIRKGVGYQWVRNKVKVEMVLTIIRVGGAPQELSGRLVFSLGPRATVARLGVPEPH